MDACTYYNVTFEVNNDIAEHDYADATIAAAGPVSIAAEDMAIKPGYEPFKVDKPEFTIAKIGQSTSTCRFLKLARLELILITAEKLQDFT